MEKPTEVESSAYKVREKNQLSMSLKILRPQTGETNKQTNKSILMILAKGQETLSEKGPRTHSFERQFL